MKKWIYSASVFLALLLFGTELKSQVASFNAPSGSICENTAQSFTNTSSGANTFMWVISGPGVQDTLYTANLNYVFNPCGTYNVELTASLNNTNPNSATQVIPIQCNPTANFFVVSPTGCVPDIVDFLETSSAGSGSISNYFWNFNDGGNSNIAHPFHTYLQTGVYSPSLTVTNSFGCADDTTIQNGIFVSGGNTLTPSATPTNICLGSYSNLNATTGSYSVNAIPYNPINGTGPTAVMGDDVTNTVPIGFNFNFYGTNYSQLEVSSNGFVSFNITGGAGCCSGIFIPSIFSGVSNFISGVQEDLNVLLAGQVTTYLSGISPNQIFTINYDSVIYFGSNNSVVTFQIDLYEGSNIIEVHIFENTDGGQAQLTTSGIENLGGTVGITPPNHNQQWFGVSGNGPHEAWRYTPVTNVTWTPAATLNFSNIPNPIATPTTTTTYNVAFINPGTGCIDSGNVTVNVQTVCAFTVDAGADTSVCDGSSIQLSGGASLGFPPYNFSWSPSTSLSNPNISNPIAQPSVTTTYTLTVTDATLASLSDTVVVVVDSILSVSVSPNTSICYNTCTSLIATANGSYIYTWSPLTGLNNGFIQNPTSCLTTTTTYTVEVEDGNGCTGTDSVTITVFPQTVLTTTPSSAFICRGDTATFNLSGCISYNVLSGTNFLMGNPLKTFPTTNTNYSVNGVDVNGCLDTTFVQVDVDTACVWPGDANHDGLADNIDLLNIGLAFNYNGTVRPNASNAWTGQPETDWVTNFTNGVNTKHADCNGDSMVNSSDTTAIYLNWGLTHPLRLHSPEENRFSLPPLAMHILEDTLHSGDTAHFVITLGDTTHPANNIYGIAFTINYDPLVVDTNTAHLNFSVCDMAPPGNQIEVHKDFWDYGMLKGAVCRTDHTGNNGTFVLATGDLIVISDNIDGKMDLLAYQSLLLSLSNVVAVRVNGQPLNVQLQSDSTYLEYNSTTVIDPPKSTDISLYPNPSDENVVINSGKLSLTKILVMNMLGQTIIELSPTSKITMMSTKSLAEGVYMIQLETESGMVIKKLVISH